MWDGLECFQSSICSSDIQLQMPDIYLRSEIERHLVAPVFSIPCFSVNSVAINFFHIGAVTRRCYTPPPC